MDFAILSGAAAAKAVLAAREKGDYSAAGLSSYAGFLKETPIYQDWETFKDAYPLLENGRLFELYPNLAAEVMEDLFAPGTHPGKKLLGSLRQHLRGKASMLTLARDLYQISRGMAI
jgi:electron transfer flavoprotein-quinone oxidoreductase